MQIPSFQLLMEKEWSQIQLKKDLMSSKATKNYS